MDNLSQLVQNQCLLCKEYILQEQYKDQIYCSLCIPLILKTVSEDRRMIDKIRKIKSNQNVKDLCDKIRFRSETTELRDYIWEVQNLENITENVRISREMGVPNVYSLFD